MIAAAVSRSRAAGAATARLRLAAKRSSGAISSDFVHRNAREKSTAAAAATLRAAKHEVPASSAAPKLARIPSLPYLGSVIPQHSGVPDTLLKPYEFWPELRRRHGDFFTIGIPNIGDANDVRHTLYVVHDPNEMLKVVRSGGAFPSGLVQSMWPNKRWFVDSGMDTVGFFVNDEEWLRLRQFMQTDLFQPAAARGYVPGMIRAAELASRGAPAAAAAKDLNEYLSRCAFDLFSTLMFGEMTETADATTPTDPENVAFVQGAIRGLSTSVQILVDPYETVVGKMMGFKTRKYRTMSEGYDAAWRIGEAKIDRFVESKERGELTENQRVSYLARAIDRQASEGSNVTFQEAKVLAWSGLFAAVDTTSNTIAWNLVHIALNPDVQDRLHDELTMAVDKFGEDGKLTAEVLERSNVPYLHAVMRETHRRTPIVGKDGIDIHGVPVSKGSVVALEGFSLGMDPNIIDDPESFLPERWLPNAVEARRGTAAETIDHPFFKDAFSQGPRKCPGSRVATNEILVMLAQLVLDWRITSPVKNLDDIEYEQRTAIEPMLPQFGFESRK
ncbi:hypothetical protein ACHAWF_005651 [Thalassiosira exigua]